MEIIVIDDDMPTVDVILSELNFEKFGIDKVHSAYNITSAKKIFEENEIGIAICDIEMPMGSGLELLKWVRENGYDAEFIFLTSHEKFDYARQAIEYNAAGYVVKPFNTDRMEAELTNALQRLHERNESQKASTYEEWYSDNLEYVEESFWNDILQQRILADTEVIRKEAEHRRLSVNIDSKYRICLVAGGNTEQVEEAWGKGNAGLYEKAASEYLSCWIFGKESLGKCINYHVKNMIYTAVIWEDEAADVRIPDAGILDGAAEKLKNTITVYVSNPYSIAELHEARQHLETLDRNNVASKGKVFNEDDEIVMSSEKGHTLDQEQIRLLLNEKRKKELLNLLKFSMESLAAQKKLNEAVLVEIRQDLLQTVLAYLSGKEIQATELFANEAAVSLERQATDSLMDMMRWQVYFISRTIDYVTEVEKSDSIVDRAKAFISEHYKEDISRTEIAGSVYLTPEYMAKMFKKETGVSLKQYITDFRVGKAKELLANPNVRISDVATEVGFDNFSYFSTVFKKTTGYSPGEYHANVNGKNQ